MWASHFVRNGNKLSISSWLTTEVQVCRNVGLPNPRLPNLLILLIVDSHYSLFHYYFFYCRFSLFFLPLFFFLTVDSHYPLFHYYFSYRRFSLFFLLLPSLLTSDFTILFNSFLTSLITH